MSAREVLQATASGSGSVDVAGAIIDQLDLWTGAVTKKSTSGRGNNGKVELTGVKKLRELILELAVHGKLVEQYLADTPADQLLDRIAERRNELICSKTIKNSKPLPPVTPDEAPSELPVGWVWTRLGSIAEINPRNAEEDTLEASFIPMPLVTTSYHGEHGDEPRSWGEIKKGYSHFANGDVGLAKITPCFENSKAAVFRNLRNGIGAGTTELHVARPLSSAINPYFLLLFLKSPRFLKEGEKVMTGSAGQKRVPKDYFSETPLPLPPSEEQHRIVQKVDELMALCDRLEQQTSDQLEAHETLVDTLLGTLTQSENATELADNWARFAAHFDTLFTTEQSIDKLKQTILQLAVMGRLVEQNFSSEDSSELLQKIENKRERLVQQGKLKGGDKQNVSEKTDTPFNLPANWSWVRISDLLPDFQNGASSRGDQSGSEVIVLRLADITNLEITLEDPRRLLISNSSINKYAVRKGDILIIRVNGSADLVGRFIPVESPFGGIFCDHFIRLRIDSEIIEPRFLGQVGSTDLIRSRIEDLFVSTAGQKTVNQKHIGSLLTPLPPIEEQHRIVQKVDELMALCDRLKERLNQASHTRRQLAVALVEQAVS